MVTLGGLIRRAWKVVGHTPHAPKTGVTLALILYGASLAILSLLVGVSSVISPADHLAATMADFAPGHSPRIATGPIPREIGYLSAPNWFIASVVLWPAMFYALRSMLDAAENAFRDIDGSPMTWMSKDNPGRVAATWARHKRLLRRLTVAIAVLALGYSAWEWWQYSRSPLLEGAKAREGELDWSSLRVGTSSLSHTVQATFSFLAFAYQSVAIALIMTFAAATILMARTMGLHGSGTEQPPLLVDVESNDPARRGGFERFVIVIDYMVLFVALAFANFFLTRVQNAYLRDNTHPSIADFISQDFLIREIDDLPDLFKITSLDFSSQAVTVGAVIILFQCFFFFNATLRHTAMLARNRSDHVLILPAFGSSLADSHLSIETVREKLKNVNVWPLGYSDLMPTLSFLTICLVTILFYRIGVYLVFLWILGWIVARAAQGLIKAR